MYNFPKEFCLKILLPGTYTDRRDNDAHVLVLEGKCYTILTTLLEGVKSSTKKLCVFIGFLVGPKIFTPLVWYMDVAQFFVDSS